MRNLMKVWWPRTCPQFSSSEAINNLSLPSTLRKFETVSIALYYKIFWVILIIFLHKNEIDFNIIFSYQICIQHPMCNQPKNDLATLFSDWLIDTPSKKKVYQAWVLVLQQKSKKTFYISIIYCCIYLIYSYLFIYYLLLH